MGLVGGIRRKGLLAARASCVEYNLCYINSNTFSSPLYISSMLRSRIQSATFSVPVPYTISTPLHSLKSASNTTFVPPSALEISCLYIIVISPAQFITDQSFSLLLLAYFCFLDGMINEKAIGLMRPKNSDGASREAVALAEEEMEM